MKKGKDNMKTSRVLVCCASVTLAVTSGGLADSRKCTIFNGTEAPIAAVQIRATGQARWQANLLAQHTVGVARSETVQISTPPCMYDFFITFDDGHRRIIQRVDVCRRTSLTVTSG